MDFALMQRVLPFFLEAAWVTVQISALALVLGVAVAAVLVNGRLSRSVILRWLAAAYVSVFRGTPCLVQLFILYFNFKCDRFNYHAILTPFLLNNIINDNHSQLQHKLKPFSRVSIQ